MLPNTLFAAVTVQFADFQLVKINAHTNPNPKLTLDYNTKTFQSPN